MTGFYLTGFDALLHDMFCPTTVLFYAVRITTHSVDDSPAVNYYLTDTLANLYITDWLTDWVSDTPIQWLPDWFDAVSISSGLTHYLGQDKDAKEMKSESEDFVLVAGSIH